MNKQPIRNFTNAYHAATQVVRKDVGQRGHKPILSIGHKEPGTEGAILAHKVLGEIYRQRGNVELSNLHITLGNADITVFD